MFSASNTYPELENIIIKGRGKNDGKTFECEKNKVLLYVTDNDSSTSFSQ